jgi:hypothetical protein
VVIRIKDWHKFQHFKDRRPPWVKLYRDLLDDLEWHELEPKAAKALVMLWLIASENDGELPDAKKLAFRLRISETATLEACSKLSHWLEQGDTNLISTGYQGDRPETETETETETDISVIDVLFSRFWDAYPRKVAKPEAFKAFKRAKPTEQDVQAMVAAIAKQGLAQKVKAGESRYVCHPATWLNQERWKDQDSSSGKASEWWLAAGFTDRFEAENAHCYERNSHQFRDGKRIPEAA